MATLFDICKTKHGTVIVKEGSTALIALTEKEALDFIRCLASALHHGKSQHFSVQRDEEGRGEI
jgi:hypothetical protein